MFNRDNVILLVQEPLFSISEGANGSAILYNITYYSDSVRSNICGSALISDSSCNKSVCTHTFNVSLSSCSSTTDIAVSVYATNHLPVGDVMSSTNVIGGYFCKFL